MKDRFAAACVAWLCVCSVALSVNAEGGTAAKHHAADNRQSDNSNANVM